MTSSGDAATAPFQTTVCPHCGARVPGASYCGACGAHLTHARRRGAARRAHAYSAFPDESVFRLAVVSSLFPQLAGRSRRCLPDRVRPHRRGCWRPWRWPDWMPR